MLCLCLLVGCPDNSVPGDNQQDGGTDGNTNGDGASDVPLDSPFDVSEDDIDGDGLPNDLEDLNRNGEYDEGTFETDLNNADTDGDTLVDGVEDANQNGQVDDGETDPRLADSDGDGLRDDAELNEHGTDPTLADSDDDGLSDGDEVNTTGTDPNNPDSDQDGLEDGDEDRNANGIVDDNETDPNDDDTDDDGVLDANEPLQIACARSRQNGVVQFEDSRGDWLLTLPDFIDETGTYALSGETNELLRAGWFQEVGGDVFGFVLIKPPQAGVRNGVEQAETEATILRSVADVSNRRTLPFASWDQFLGGIVQLDLSFDSEMTAADVRDLVTTTMSRRASFEVGTSTPGGASATDWTLGFSVTMRTEGRAVVVGALTPAAAAVDNPAVLQQLLDITDGTVLSQFGDELDQACSLLEVTTESFDVDFLWLVDRSLSMQDDRQQVIDLSAQFFDTLAATLLDYRLAVASMGLHNNDNWVLVEPGFSSSRQDFIDQMADPFGADLEYGLETGIRIATLARGSATSGGSHARASAKLIVVFFTDEQDQGIEGQIDQDVPGCNPADDVNLGDCQLLQNQIDDYLEKDIIAFAITGDLPDGCGDAEGATPGYAEEGGYGYVQTAFATGGGFGSICSTDFSQVIDDMILAAFGAASSYRLNPPPIAHTIRVVLDGALLERSRENGFDFEPASGSLLFFGDGRPTLSSEIYVSYRHFLDLTADPEPDTSEPD